MFAGRPQAAAPSRVPPVAPASIPRDQPLFDKCISGVNESFGLVLQAATTVMRNATANPTTVTTQELSTRLDEFETSCDKLYQLLEQARQQYQQHITIIPPGVAPGLSTLLTDESSSTLLGDADQHATGLAQAEVPPATVPLRAEEVELQLTMGSKLRTLLSAIDQFDESQLRTLPSMRFAEGRVGGGPPPGVEGPLEGDGEQPAGGEAPMEEDHPQQQQQQQGAGEGDVQEEDLFE